MYTGDDFNYAGLIEGDALGHRPALLGISDPIAPAAAAALAAPGAGDRGRFRDVLGPTVPLSPKIFETPPRYYRAGVVLLAWLNGHPDHFVMVGGRAAETRASGDRASRATPPLGGGPSVSPRFRRPCAHAPPRSPRRFPRSSRCRSGSAA
jgi:hypothetical protein